MSTREQKSRLNNQRQTPAFPNIIDIIVSDDTDHIGKIVIDEEL